MTNNIHPQGESLKKAILWIAENRKEDPKIDLAMLVDRAAFQFDLSPKDSEFLLRFVKAEKG
jgi:hypothetical protein